MIAHRVDRGPSVSRSSFQRACARIGLSILELTLRACQAIRLARAGLVPARRERNDTEGPLSCQPFCPKFFRQFLLSPDGAPNACRDAAHRTGASWLISAHYVDES